MVLVKLSIKVSNGSKYRKSHNINYVTFEIFGSSKRNTYQYSQILLVELNVRYTKTILLVAISISASVLL